MNKLSNELNDGWIRWWLYYLFTVRQERVIFLFTLERANAMVYNYIQIYR